MNSEQIAAAKARATEVTNGFKCATGRNARDALNLVTELETRDREIAGLKRQLAESQNKSDRASADDIFSTIFGGGKKP